MRKISAVILSIFCVSSKLFSLDAEIKEIEIAMPNAQCLLGVIKEKSLLYVDENDEIVGNYYFLDTGYVLFHPTGGVNYSRWEDGKYVVKGGVWEQGETLLISVDINWSSQNPIEVHNADRKETRAMLVIKTD